jgi:hypothetical protein
MHLLTNKEWADDEDDIETVARMLQSFPFTPSIA